MVYQDKTLTCMECGNSFTFSADDQQYHAEKGYTNEPKRCPSCRAARRARGGGGGGGGGRMGGGGDMMGGQREMYKITCSQCGKEGEVPFMPRGDRPVYCRDCYGSRPERAMGGGGRGGGGRY